jgi:SRSO17 transposase
VAAGHSVDPIRWRAAFDELMGRVAGRFGRVEPRRHARALVLGLLADLPRKSCWTIAEHAGTTSPDGLQHLLARAVWDADALRDDLRDYVYSHLGDPEAVLVIDETGDLKKGTATAGVQRHYTGTAGKIDNSQVAVYLAYATKAGHAMTGSCTCPGAGPATVTAAAPPASPTRSPSPPSRRWPPGCSPVRWTPGWWPAGWPATRSTAPTPSCVPRSMPAGSATYWRCLRPPGACGRRPLPGRRPGRPGARWAWQCISAGRGAKGHRLYDWAFVQLDHCDGDSADQHWLLIRRNPTTGELAFYACFAPARVTLAELVAVAGMRWAVEMCQPQCTHIRGLAA